MNPAEEKRLLQLMDEVNSGESQNSSSDPYSSDDDVEDPTYETEDNSSCSSDQAGDEEHAESENLPTKNLLDNEEEWCDIITDIPNFHFDESGCGIRINSVDNLPTVNCCIKLYCKY